jgi:DNA-binding transcriptional LysR family regulator
VTASTISSGPAGSSGRARSRTVRPCRAAARSQHHRIGWYSGYPTRERIAFHGPSDIVSLELKPAMLTNSVHLLREYALEHAGIVCIPTLVASDAVLSGQLRIVLPTHQLTAFWLSIFYPTSQRSSLKLKLFLDMLTGSFTSTPPWDEALIERGLLQRRVIE